MIHYELLENHQETYLYKNGKLTCLDIDVDHVVLDEEKGLGYGVEVLNGYYDGMLYSFDITNSADGKCQLIDDKASDVAATNNGNIYYYYYEDEEISLLCNGTIIQDISSIFSIDVHGDRIYFCEYYGKDNEYKILKYEENGTITTVAENVKEYLAFDNNQVAIITDYSESKKWGVLYLYTEEGELIEIDDRVNSIFNSISVDY